MVGRIEFDKVDPVASRIVGAEDGTELVRKSCPVRGFGAARSRAKGNESSIVGRDAFTGDGFAQQAIGREEIDADKRRRLIEYGVRLERPHRSSALYG
jgi:hypothetical protein